MDDEEWMRHAIDAARAAQAHEDVPIGCVVVDGQGRELSRGHNRREIDGDPTAHAEIVALRSAAAALGHWRVEGATVYVTLEPCAMCAGALVNARVRRVVFGTEDPKAGAVVSLFEIGRDTRLNHRFEVTGGVLAEDARQLLRDFFEKLRAAGEK